ncbi:hypothetical protein bpmyx0001_8230 [Bacillus pseudomycoides DSM 12442]|nr:hypothetical protein bpmyx0001_8230 [Bacillus pseudomycoides DSM 12442]
MIVFFAPEPSSLCEMKHWDFSGIKNKIFFYFINSHNFKN